MVDRRGVMTLPLKLQLSRYDGNLRGFLVFEFLSLQPDSNSVPTKPIQHSSSMAGSLILPVWLEVPPPSGKK